MAEVIDFFWPNEPGKILYVTNIINDCLNEDIITVIGNINIYQIFSHKK